VIILLVFKRNSVLC